MPSTTKNRGYPGYESWPHPRGHRPEDEPVDPRLIRLIRRALRSSDPADQQATAEFIAARVWHWLAEGD